MKKCTRCKQQKALRDFTFVKYKNRKRSTCKEGIRSSVCRACCAEFTAKWVSQTLTNGDVTAALKITLSRLLAYSKANAHNKTVAHDLTKEFLWNLYNKQEGRCFYTNVPMHLKGKLVRDPLSISIDRKDPALGYIEENVVLCCLGVNYLKGTNSVEQLHETLQVILENMTEMNAVTKEKMWLSN